MLLKEMNNASQTCQDDSCYLEIATTEEKNNEELNSTVKLSKYEEKNNILKGSTIASPK